MSTRVRLALARASVTASFHNPQGSSSASDGDVDPVLGQGEVVADMGFHELAALQLVRMVGLGTLALGFERESASCLT